MASMQKQVRIAAIEGKRSLVTGEKAEYRVHLDAGARQPVTYTWDLSDGSQATGSQVVLTFEQAGLYTLLVTARNRDGLDRDTVRIHVNPTKTPPAAPPDLPAAEAPPATPVVASAVDTPSAPSPPRSRTVRSSTPLLVWPQTGYTWVVATHLHRQQADMAALRYQRAGFQAGIVVDEQGSGSTAYRVVVGHYATPQAALQSRARLPADRPGGVLLLQLSDSLTVKPSIR